MSLARDLIASLDRDLLRAGHDATLRRMTRTTPTTFGVAQEVLVRAVVRSIGRGYQTADLVGNIAQGDLAVIISPTPLIAAGWQSGRIAPDDLMVPMKGNILVSGGRVLSVEGCVAIRVQNVIVRIELQVRG